MPTLLYGGTVLPSGTLNINGIYALGGGDYGGLTFNGGTLQYVTNFSATTVRSDLTSIGTAGVTLAAGGGTIDVNGNAVTYAGSIGNGGSGALTVVNSMPATGSLTLNGAQHLHRHHHHQQRQIGAGQQRLSQPAKTSTSAAPGSLMSRRNPSLF